MTLTRRIRSLFRHTWEIRFLDRWGRENLVWVKARTLPEAEAYAAANDTTKGE